MTTALRVYRRSQVEDADCLHRWNEINNNGVDDSSDYSLRGQAFAHIKHLYIQQLVAQHVTADADEALQAFIHGIAEHQTPQRLIPELRELWVRHAEVFQLDLDRYVASEERQEGDGVSWTPDLVYAHPDELEIIDDKTYWAMLTEVEVRQSFQGRFYARQARLRFPHFARYRFTMFFVRYNKPVSVVYTDSELDAVEVETQAAIARLTYAADTNQWPAVAGPSCRYCELRCPIASLETRMPVRLSKDLAPKVAAAILVGDKALKGLKKALKAYCATNGPVSVGGVEFDNRPVLERKYPIHAVVQELQLIEQAGGLDADGLTISQSALGSMFRRFPLLQERLAGVMQTKDVWRFGPRQAGEDEEE